MILLQKKEIHFLTSMKNNNKTSYNDSTSKRGNRFNTLIFKYLENTNFKNKKAQNTFRTSALFYHKND